LRDSDVDVWLQRVHLDAADSIAFDDGHSDVAIFTPVGTPRVLDYPILNSFLADTVSNGEHSVVVLISTCGVIKDTRGVTLENVRCLEVDGEWLLDKGSLHLVDVAGSHSGPVGDQHLRGLGLRVLASSIDALVRVGLLGHGVVGGQVIESQERISAIASGILRIAVDELLLRESNKISRGNSVSALNATSG
jgi:hypothetical protein